MAVIEPTLDDAAVMEFVATGFVLLEGVIDDAFNAKCDKMAGGNIDAFIGDDEFTKAVLLHPKIAGVARSLLGEDFLVPAGGHHHLYEAPHLGQTWHSDGLSGLGYDVTELQCYYYPQAVEIEDGPTMILPGSHCRAVDREAIAHYGDIRGQMSLTVPAGTVAMTRYGIWHKAGPKTNDRRRGMIKFSYHRQATPQRDWKVDAPEIPEYRNQPRLAYVTEVESYRDRVRRMRTWNWLCGLDEESQLRWERSRPVSEIA
ncbi:MAG: hypothetical protein HOM68_29615 [Gemmatimonadetes bacterium]|jgi:hypothetical protein|nr:hypothetical protein [Gemmatimonadota bacterium]MBT4611626.1 hypothetical protein [Gemmatimonadota bacterium]MBT5060740.1 hypothetical protein [Gemmatimonadota bacterium]MBT5145351.1 hypothetical protein [Gemmatimonadota bacterium]MBT5591539.1 hypothetical protein [Gemmatimonadota bacterium]